MRSAQLPVVTAEEVAEVAGVEVGIAPKVGVPDVPAGLGDAAEDTGVGLRPVLDADDGAVGATRDEPAVDDAAEATGVDLGAVVASGTESDGWTGDGRARDG